MLRSLTASFQNLGLQRRIMLFVTAGLLFFSAVYGFFALQAIRQASDLVFRERISTAQTVARGMDDGLAHVQREAEDTGAQLTAALAANSIGDAERLLGALYEHWNRDRLPDASLLLVVTDPEGLVVLSEPRRPALIGRRADRVPMMQAALGRGGVTIESGSLFDDAPAPTAVVQTALRSDAMVAGYLLGQVSRAQVQEWLAPGPGGGDAGFVAELLDTAGRVIASNIPGGRTTSLGHLNLVRPLWSAGEAGTLIHSVPNGGHVIAFAPLQRIAWGVIVEQEVDEALILPRTLAAQFLGFGLLALAGGLGLAWATTRAVVRPVVALTEASKAIAEGDLEHLLDVSGQGELGVFARSFDDMRQRLRASRVEIAGWNKELSERVLQRTRELRALVESSRALTSTLVPEALFAILMEQTREVLPSAEGISLFLFDAETRTLRPHTAYGFDKDNLLRLRLEIGEGIAGRVFESQRPELLRSKAELMSAHQGLAADNRARFSAAIGTRTPKSALGVPLVSKGARLGAFMLFSFSRESAFADSDIDVLQALADQAAAAIENTRLYSEVQQKEAQLTQLLEKLIEAQEAEHKSIARELHDEFAQTLTALTMNLQTTAQALPPEQDGLRRSLSETQALTAQMLKGISTWILELRPSVLDDLGLVPAIRWYAESRLDPAGIRMSVEAVGFRQRLPASMEASLFRIAQEAVTNIVKYSGAREVRIRLDAADGRIRLGIEDDGKGFDVAEAMRPKDSMRGLGLLGMRERAMLLGGRLAIDSRPGSGTRIVVEVPWKEKP